MRLVALILGAALTAACGGVDAPSEANASWSIDLSTTNGALMGVWGTSPEDVWVVGGQADRSIVLHGDGTHWTPFDVDGSSLLFTVYGFAANDVYAVGERGLILHFNGETWQRIESGTELPLYGVWGTSGEDVWIVGGDRFGSAGSAVVLRGSHGSFHAVKDLPAELAPNVLFKVHGFATDDVVMVGSEGVLRWNGTQWRRDPVPTSGPLFSAWGSGPDDLYAVGGLGIGEILRFDGQAWREVVQLPIDRGLSGVFTSADGPTFAVGAHAFIFELGRDGAFTQAAVPAMDTLPFLHAVWGDDQGTTYTVGGDLSAYPSSMSGVILRRH